MKNVLVAILVLITSQTKAQVVSPMKIGDTIPDFRLSGVVNHTSETISLKDYRGKIIILDFWATWCSPCLRDFKRNDSIQKIFNGEIIFIPVTDEAGAIAKNTLKHFGNKMSVTGKNNKLRILFPHVSLPHYVWINKDGKVSAITQSEDLTVKNLKQLLANNSLTLALKSDDSIIRATSSQMRAPFFRLSSPVAPIDGVIGDTNQRFYSIFTRYIPNVWGHVNWNVPIPKISFVNISPGNMLQLVLTKFSQKSIWNQPIKIGTYEDSLGVFGLFEKSDSSFLSAETVRSHKQAFSNVYEIVGYKGMSFDSLCSLAARELNMQFETLYGIKGFVETEEQLGYTLVSIGNNDGLRTKGVSREIQNDFFNFRGSNIKLATFVQALRNNFRQYVAFIEDETNINDNVDLEITNTKLTNVPLLNAKLAAYGLMLKEIRRPVSTVVIRRVNNNRVPWSPPSSILK